METFSRSWESPDNSTPITAGAPPPAITSNRTWDPTKIGFSSHRQAYQALTFRGRGTSLTEEATKEWRFQIGNPAGNLPNGHQHYQLLAFMGGNSFTMTNHMETDIFKRDTSLPNPHDKATLKKDILGQLYGDVIQPSPPRVAHKKPHLSNEQWQEWVTQSQGGWEIFVAAGQLNEDLVGKVVMEHKEAGKAAYLGYPTIFIGHGDHDLWSLPAGFTDMNGVVSDILHHSGATVIDLRSIIGEISRSDNWHPDFSVEAAQLVSTRIVSIMSCTSRARHWAAHEMPKLFASSRKMHRRSNPEPHQTG